MEETAELFQVRLVDRGRNVPDRYLGVIRDELTETVVEMFNHADRSVVSKHLLDWLSTRL